MDCFGLDLLFQQLLNRFETKLLAPRAQAMVVWDHLIPHLVVT